MNTELKHCIIIVSCMWAGVYLCTHDFPVLGGWICILTILGA